MQEPNEPRIVFLGGTGRCGTNIACHVLSRSPSVAALPFEYRFVIDPGGIVDFYNSVRTWSPFIYDARVRELERLLRDVSRRNVGDRMSKGVTRLIDSSGRTIAPSRYADWELERWIPHFDQHVSSLMDLLVEEQFPACWPGAESFALRPRVRRSRYRTQAEVAAILRGFFHRCVEEILAAQQAQVFVEDNTWNALLARELAELFPSARLIHMVRDPRDTVASLVTQRWAPSDLRQAVRFYQSMMRRWQDIEPALPAGFYIVVRLEDMVARPEVEIGRMCTFIGLDHHAGMFEVDLGASNQGRWRTDLDAGEREFIGSELAEFVDALGYER